MVNKNARHICDAFLAGSKYTTVTGDNTEITVDNYGIDKTELTKARSELINLLGGVRSCIIYVRD